MLTVLLRAFEVWLLIAAAESIHGALRVALLEPLAGDFRARQIAVFSGALIIFAIACLFRDWIGAASLRGRIAVGALWVVLTVAFELVLGRLVMDLSWERVLSDYNIPAGGMMPVGLLVMFFAPALAHAAGNAIARPKDLNGIDAPRV